MVAVGGSWLTGFAQCQWHWQILMMLNPRAIANDDTATNSNVRRLHQQLPS